MTFSATSASQVRAEDILESLTRVIAPSFGANLYDLGFIYGIEVNHGVATIQMTLPASDHPDREQIVGDIHDILRRRHPALEEIVIDFSFEPPWREDFITEAGRQQMAAAPMTRAPASGGAMPTSDDIRESLMYVIDPEVGINIVDLGLIYEVRVEGTAVDIEMTLTTPGCPLHETIAAAVQRTLETRHPGIGDIRLELVWDPPWDTDMITDAGREQLGW